MAEEMRIVLRNADQIDLKDILYSPVDTGCKSSDVSSGFDR